MNRAAASLRDALPMILVLLAFQALASPALAETWQHVESWTPVTTGLGSSDFQPKQLALDHTFGVRVAEGVTKVHTFTRSGSCVDTLDYAGGVAGGVAVDSRGYLYLTDPASKRVRVYDNAGVSIATWGTTGSDTAQFQALGGVAVAPGDTVYVVDKGNSRVQVFDRDGHFIRAWGSFGNVTGKFNDPFSIAVDDSGYVYVGETPNHRIQKFNRTGAFVRTWGSFSAQDGDFYAPAGIAVDRTGRVYVVDASLNRVQVFDSAGVYLAQWGTAGAGSGQFDGPTGIVVDELGIVYVCDTYRVQKFVPSSVLAVGDAPWLATLELAPPSPNPSSGPVLLRFALPTASAASLALYDMQGRRVAGWEWDGIEAGPHQVAWSGRAQDGRVVPPGLLFCRLSAGGRALTQRLAHVK